MIALIVSTSLVLFPAAFCAARHRCLIESDAARQAGWTGIRRSPAIRFCVLLLVMTISVLLGCCLSDAFCQRLPLSWQRNVQRLAWNVILPPLSTLMGWMCGLAVFRKDRQSGFLLRSVGVLGVLLAFLCVRANSEIHSQLFEKRSPDGSILQSHSVSCVPASMANALRIHGVEVSEQQVARIVGSTNLGTSVGAMRYGFDRLRCDFRTLTREHSDISRVQGPAVLIVDHPATGGESHAVLYVGVVGERIELIDPLQGRCFVDVDRFGHFWHGQGVECLAVRNSSDSDRAY